MANDMVSKQDISPSDLILPLDTHTFIVEELGASKYQDVLDFAEKTTEITSKIQTLCKEIDKAKKKNLSAKKMDTRADPLSHIPLIGKFFDDKADKLEKQNQLIMEVDEMQNSAIMELNNLMQEMINFGCTTFTSATIMVYILAQLLEDGKIEVNGKIVRLTEATKKHIRDIKANIQSFLDQHQEHRSNIEQIKIDIKEIKGDIKKNEEDIGLNKENIVQNQQNIGQNKENIEKNRNEIEMLHSKLKDKENIDNAQEQEIKNLKTKLENLEAKVDKKGSFIPYLFSVFALLIAIISLAMNFIDFTK